MAIFDVGYSYNWGFPVIAGLAFEITVCDAVFELLQAVSGLLGTLTSIGSACGSSTGRRISLLCCRLCIGLGLLCGGGIGLHGIHQLLPCRGARFRICAVLRAGVGRHTVAQICTCHGAGAIASLEGDAAIAGLCGHAGGNGHRAVLHQ